MNQPTLSKKAETKFAYLHGIDINLENNIYREGDKWSLQQHV